MFTRYVNRRHGYTVNRRHGYPVIIAIQQFRQTSSVSLSFIHLSPPEQLWNNLSAIHPKQPIAISPALTLQLFVLILNLRRKVLSDFSMIPTKATDSLLEEIQHVVAEQFSISVTVFKY